jgi:magnesium chelatase family protein
MLTNLIRQQCALDATGERTLQMAMKRMSLSDRAITDLDASLSIAARHIAEAIPSRSLDRNYWS